MGKIISKHFKPLLSQELNNLKNYLLIQIVLLLIDNACLFTNIFKLSFSSKNIVY